MGFHDPRVDQLLDEARMEMDYVQRAGLYREIQTLVMHSAPLVPQLVNSDGYLMRSWVNGAALSHLGATYLPFRSVWFDQRRRTGNSTPAVAARR
jgi:ABC-type transport system substrate-binding protein